MINQKAIDKMMKTIREKYYHDLVKDIENRDKVRKSKGSKIVEFPKWRK